MFIKAHRPKFHSVKMVQTTMMSVLQVYLAALVCSIQVLALSKTQPNLVEGLLRRDSANQVSDIKTERATSSSMPSDSRQYKCQILNTLYRTTRMRNPGSSSNLISSQMMLMLQNCSRDFRSADVFNQPFIFPGTIWCGQGNIAENFHHLGVYNATDACCREHDYCDDIIRPGRTKHNLVNPYGTTRLHCKCDRALRQCFKEVDSVISNTVGYIFFSLLQTQCYDLDFPAIGCEQWRRGSVRTYCVKYQVDETQPKKWQWFDQEPYL